MLSGEKCSNTVVNEEGRGGKEGEEREKGVISIFSNTLATHTCSTHFALYLLSSF